jgi:hypothetical protein
MQVIDLMAPQVGLEPTTLRLTVPEICVPLDLRGIVIRIDPLREHAHSQRVTRRLLGARRPAATHIPSATDCDRFLEAVGKELGKEKSRCFWRVRRHANGLRLHHADAGNLHHGNQIAHASTVWRLSCRSHDIKLNVFALTLDRSEPE